MAMQKMGFAIIIMVMLSSTLVYSDSKTDEAALSKATFAGGCFWCMEPPFDKLDTPLFLQLLLPPETWRAHRSEVAVSSARSRR
jgi:hypothetical protein